jgi:hypothetical protein
MSEARNPAPDPQPISPLSHRHTLRRGQQRGESHTLSPPEIGLSGKTMTKVFSLLPLPPQGKAELDIRVINQRCQAVAKKTNSAVMGNHFVACCAIVAALATGDGTMDSATAAQVAPPFGSARSKDRPRSVQLVPVEIPMGLKIVRRPDMAEVVLQWRSRWGRGAKCWGAGVFLVRWPRREPSPRYRYQV